MKSYSSSGVARQSHLLVQSISRSQPQPQSRSSSSSFSFSTSCSIPTSSSPSPSSSSSASTSSTPSRLETLSQKLKATQPQSGRQSNPDSNRPSQSFSRTSQSSSSSHRDPRSNSTKRDANRGVQVRRNGNGNGDRRSTSKPIQSSNRSISPLSSIPLPASLQPKTPWSSLLHSISTPNSASLPLLSPPKYPHDELNLNTRNPSLPYPDLPKRPLRLAERSLRFDPLRNHGAKPGLLGNLSEKNFSKGFNVEAQRGVGKETVLMEKNEGGKDKDNDKGKGKAEAEGEGKGKKLTSHVGLERKLRELKIDEEIGGDYGRFTPDHLIKLAQQNGQNGNGEIKKSIALALKNNIDLSPEAKIWCLKAVEKRIGKN